MKIKTIVCAALVVGCLGAPASLAQGWSGSLALAFVEQSVDGSEGSFRTQTYLDDGFYLDDLDLRYRGAEDKRTELTLRASGFGGAEPSQSLDLALRLDRPWRLELDYDRRESFFALAGFEQDQRHDDWQVERWHAGVVWDGWKAARLRLDLRTSDRSGRVERPLFGLNELYLLRLDLDETMQETAFSLETRTLPVSLRFEQSFTTYERANRRSPAASLNLDGDDVDLFTIADEQLREDRDIPTTRLVVSYADPRWEVVGSLVYSPAELDGAGPVSEGFAIGGGAIGTAEFVDELVSSAEMDSLVGNLRLGIRLAPRWTLRLEGDYRDTATDATLLGQRLLRVTNPFGNVFEIAGAVDVASRYDVSENSLRLTVEWSGGDWTLWGGAFSASRDVAWRRLQSSPEVDVSRDSDGFLVGASWSRGGLRGSAEYQHGTFDDLVFRTDPETVDRFSLRLRAELGGGWQARLHGRLSDAEHPAPALAGSGYADLDRSSETWGAALDWSSDDGEHGVGIGVDQSDFTSDIDLVLPDGSAGASFYDLSLVTASLHGRSELGKVRLSGSALRLDDSGATWPVESWIARARIGFMVRSDVELSAFGEYWTYDEERAQRDDYDVTRYGLGFRWSFP